MDAQTQAPQSLLFGCQPVRPLLIDNITDRVKYGRNCLMFPVNDRQRIGHDTPRGLVTTKLPFTSHRVLIFVKRGFIGNSHSTATGRLIQTGPGMASSIWETNLNCRQSRYRKKRLDEETMQCRASTQRQPLC